VAAPEELQRTVARLSQEAGLDFNVTDQVVRGTQLYVVYTQDHPFPAVYAVKMGTLGFRIPGTFPDAGPEDSFFIQPATTKLECPDPVRGSIDINRAGQDPNFLAGTLLETEPALVFSWHLWNTRPWDRRRHTLMDQYTHCLRRFEQPEHD
jgi:hypothetical protein